MPPFLGRARTGEPANRPDGDVLADLSVSAVYAQTLDVPRPSETVKDILAGPKNQPKSDTYYLVALSYAKKGAMNEAFQSIETGLSLQPMNTRLLNLRAALWAQSGRVNEAIGEFKRILTVSPDDSYARSSLKTLEGPLKLSKPPVVPPSKPAEPAKPATTASSTAEASAASAPRKLEPTYFDEMQGKQRCYYGMAAIKRAQEKREADKPDTKGKYDSKQLVEGKFIAAIPVCPQGGEFNWKGSAPECSKHGGFAPLEAEINTIFTDFNYGLKAKFGRNFPEARAAFKKVTTMYPQWCEAHYQLGDTEFRLGEDKDAIDEIKVCLKIDPKHFDAKLLLANLYFKTGQKETSVRLLEEILKAAPNSIHAISAKSILASIKSGKNYYQIFPPN